MQKEKFEEKKIENWEALKQILLRAGRMERKKCIGKN